ncbi:MAG TPA: M23 family metallopeptidase [Mariprofundaceae bacterium]|nr:M23 family metallopeptidase [Mariprofundaceae bacterium]
MKQFHTLLFLLILLLFPLAAVAESYTATQGDVLTLHRNIPHGETSLTCFGKQWPVVREADGKVWAWIGVDLKTKTGVYPMIWKTGNWQRSDQLTVNKGEFRISRITVDKKMSVFGKEELKRIRSDQKQLKDSYVVKVDASPFIHITQLPTKGIESTPFGAQRYVNGAPRSPHSGIDIAAPEGSPVITPLAGKVLVAESMYLNGNTIAIGHGHGLVSVFSHLKKASVKKGDWIEAGQQIGEVGMTGRTTGPHLHWSLRFQQARINPYSIMRGEAK